MTDRHVVTRPAARNAVFCFQLSSARQRQERQQGGDAGCNRHHEGHDDQILRRRRKLPEVEAD
jgi:hypothetical protein